MAKVTSRPMIPPAQPADSRASARPDAARHHPTAGYPHGNLGAGRLLRSTGNGGNPMLRACYARRGVSWMGARALAGLKPCRGAGTMACSWPVRRRPLIVCRWIAFWRYSSQAAAAALLRIRGARQGLTPAPAGGALGYLRAAPERAASLVDRHLGWHPQARCLCNPSVCACARDQPLRNDEQLGVWGVLRADCSASASRSPRTTCSLPDGSNFSRRVLRRETACRSESGGRIALRRRSEWRVRGALSRARASDVVLCKSIKKA